MINLLPVPTEFKVTGFNYEAGSSVKLNWTPGNPRHTRPAELTITLDNSKNLKIGTPVASVRNLKSKIKDVVNSRGGKYLKRLVRTDNRERIIRDTIVGYTVYIENNPYYMKNTDNFDYPLCLSEMEIDAWVIRIVNHPNWK